MTAAIPDEDGRVRVVVCDDDELFADALRTTLASDPRLEVVGVAPDGQKALELVRSAPDVDVLLLDIEMPQMDGIDTLRALHEWPRRPAVMMLTGVTDGDVIKRAEHAGPDAFLRKSVDPEEVINGILIVRELVRAARGARAADSDQQAS